VIIYGNSTIVIAHCLHLRICFVCPNHNPVLSSFMTYHRACNKSNKTGATCGAGTATLPEHLRSTTVYGRVRVARSLYFCVMFCRSLFALFVCSLHCQSFFDLRLLLIIWLTFLMRQSSICNVLDISISRNATRSSSIDHICLDTI